MPRAAQRRQLEVDDVDAVVEVLAEAALLDRGLQVAVGGGDDARVEGHLGGAAQGPHLCAPAARAAAWAASPSGSSPTSSRKSVPPLAWTKRPVRSARASVKAPRAWPNSSLSSSASGMAAQLSATKGPSLRRLRAWSARATTSLPVPLSPVMSTVASESGHAGDELVHLAHRRALADQRVEALRLGHALAQALHLLAQARGAATARSSASTSASTLEGLGDEVVGARADGRDGGVEAAEGGDDAPPARPGGCGRRARTARAPLMPGMLRSVTTTSSAPRGQRLQGRGPALGHLHLEAAPAQRLPRRSHMLRSSSTMRIVPAHVSFSSRPPAGRGRRCCPGRARSPRRSSRRAPARCP